MTKILNVFIICDLTVWPRNLTINLKQEYLKNSLFGATKIVKNSDKEKYVYNGYGITFNSTDWWSFGNDTARNFIIFGVDNS